MYCNTTVSTIVVKQTKCPATRKIKSYKTPTGYKTPCHPVFLNEKYIFLAKTSINRTKKKNVICLFYIHAKVATIFDMQCESVGMVDLRGGRSGVRHVPGGRKNKFIYSRNKPAKLQNNINAK